MPLIVCYCRNVTALDLEDDRDGGDKKEKKKLILYPDPIVKPFDDGVLYFTAKNDYLTINVSQFDPLPCSNT